MTYSNIVTRFKNYKFNLVERENEHGKYFSLISSHGHLMIFSDTYNDSILNSSILIDPCGKLDNWHKALYIGKYPETEMQWNEIITVIQNFSDLKFIGSGIKLKENEAPKAVIKTGPILSVSDPGPDNIKPLLPRHLRNSGRNKFKKNKNSNFRRK